MTDDLATIALCIGHSRRRADGTPEGGAITHDGAISEWAWNRELAREIATVLHDRHGLHAVIINDYGRREYDAAMAWLARHLRDLGGIRLAVELHFNSHEPAANGHEWLHWHSSTKGRLAATELHLAMSRHFPGLRARGVKPRASGDLGALFLRLTHCPAVIAEPFFGSNAQDWRALSGRAAALAAALAEGIAAGHARL